MIFIYKILSTFFYLGYLPASGTFGTLASIPLIYLLKKYLSPFYLTFTLIFFVISIYISDETEKIFNKKDPKEIIIDEVLGFLIVFIFNDFNNFNLILGFILFRILDIFKPSIISKVQNIRGGYGIVLDDALAGFITSLLVYFINLYK